jgi:hypothetical protein
MTKLMDSPFFVFTFSFIVMWLSARIGISSRKRHPLLEEDVHRDLDVIVAATLTLLALIVGFSFSMAIDRYDQRKNYEEAEANTIGTEYLRAGLLPADDGTRVRALLRDYLNQRISFYETRDGHELEQINAYTAQLEAELWSAVQAPAVAQPIPTAVLAASGMNDVLDSQGYTQAAWWNRIPIEAWALMVAIAICSNALVGYGARRPKARMLYYLVLPLVLSIAFFLIADIDSPRRGAIRVHPENLINLAQSLDAR